MNALYESAYNDIEAMHLCTAHARELQHLNLTALKSRYASDTCEVCDGDIDPADYPVPTDHE